MKLVSNVEQYFFVKLFNVTLLVFSSAQVLFYFLSLQITVITSWLDASCWTVGLALVYLWSPVWVFTLWTTLSLPCLLAWDSKDLPNRWLCCYEHFGNQKLAHLHTHFCIHILCIDFFNTGTLVPFLRLACIDFYASYLLNKWINKWILMYYYIAKSLAKPLCIIVNRHGMHCCHSVSTGTTLVIIKSSEAEIAGSPFWRAIWWRRTGAHASPYRSLRVGYCHSASNIAEYFVRDSNHRRHEWA